ncbi:MAG: type II toxin-antitoxin system prevent-host-death family antitoxin, partial [Candidatus Marinimicrobia bacterium]|nr:type II toxin-antitoxin system prevent-host-death family antitoxin [Candidatus Neomarinimicrobiota bacterium]
MKTLSLSEVKMKLSQFVEEVNETDNPISITRNGEAVAALISQELFQGYLDTIDIMRDVNFYQSIQTNMKLLERGEGISLTIDELFKERTKSDEKPSSVRIKVLP